mmetsp:Transcript_81019/g.203974  ORF Transcript_81019/g.203974 Transcript_81019/m.203974 type:complete len:277 (+) Transcript_81019:259-1089(+)
MFASCKSAVNSASVLPRSVDPSTMLPCRGDLGDIGDLGAGSAATELGDRNPEAGADTGGFQAGAGDCCKRETRCGEVALVSTATSSIRSSDGVNERSVAVDMPLIDSGMLGGHENRGWCNLDGFKPSKPAGSVSCAFKASASRSFWPLFRLDETLSDMKADDRLGATHDARRDAGLSVADFHRAWSLDFTDGPSSSESSSKRSCHNALTLPTMDLRLHVRTFCSRIGSDSFAAKAACIASRMAKAFLKICANSHGSVTSIAARDDAVLLPICGAAL